MFRVNSLWRCLSIALPFLLMILAIPPPTAFLAQAKKTDEQKQGMGSFHRRGSHLHIQTDGRRHGFESARCF